MSYSTHTYGGDPNNTTYRTSYANNYLYTGGYTFPSGWFDSAGRRLVRVDSVGTDWSTGATYHQVEAGGLLTSGGRTYVNPGTFAHRVGHGSGTLGAGRNTTNGKTMTDSADGDTVTGGICGWFTWSTAPAAPTMLEATPKEAGKILVRFQGGDNGGADITGWKLQASLDAGFTQVVATLDSSGTTTFQGVPGTTYWFRAAGRNGVTDAVGTWGGFSASKTATAKSGGKVSAGAAWRTAVWRVSVAGVHRDAIVRASVGGTWRDAI